MQSILVIEDEPTILSNTMDVLEFEGYAVRGAENGRVGIELACAQLPDLILCDIMMPECDGYGVLNTLVNCPETRSIPLVMMSARVDTATLREVIKLGASDYLPKPFTLAQLMAVVHRHLNATG